MPQPNQLHVRREDVVVAAPDLLSLKGLTGAITTAVRARGTGVVLRGETLLLQLACCRALLLLPHRLPALLACCSRAAAAGLQSPA
jgi:hypothetical protein